MKMINEDNLKMVAIGALALVCLWGFWIQLKKDNEPSKCYNTTKTFQTIVKDDNGEVINVTDEQVSGQNCEGTFIPNPDLY